MLFSAVRLSCALLVLLVACAACSGPTDLTIVVQDAGKTSTWRLTCDPIGGDHPDPTTACRVLDQHGASALPAVQKGAMCTEIYGGPQTATITGTWQGKPVTSTLSRTNGCEISRWRALEGLLPKAGG